MTPYDATFWNTDLMSSKDPTGGNEATGSTQAEMHLILILSGV